MKGQELFNYIMKNPELTAAEVAQHIGKKREYVSHFCYVNGISTKLTKIPYSLKCCKGNKFILQCFKGMHDRVRDGKCPSIEWERNQKGFELFAKEIGELPSEIERPSVGRKDHSKGYSTGNIMWECYLINSGKHKGSENESNFNKSHSRCC